MKQYKPYQILDIRFFSVYDSYTIFLQAQFNLIFYVPLFGCKFLEL